MNWKTVSLVVLLMILIFPGVTYGQNDGWEDVGSVVRLEDNPDNVGIGTPSPAEGYKLHVSGYFKATGISTFVASGASRISVVGGADQSVGTGADAATISGGRNHRIGQDVDYATVGGGNWNDVYSDYGTICGGVSNDIGSYSGYGFIGGGYGNRFVGDSHLSTIAGGYYNQIAPLSTDDANYAVIGGGAQNTIYSSTGSDAHYAVIGGGKYNQSSARYATVCGGYSNVAGGEGATVWGYDNDARGDYSTAGGRGVDATHQGSTAIGYYSFARANYSTALGWGAIADDAYSFVWSDGSTCYSTNTEQFRVCARNGAWFTDEVSALCFDDRPGNCSRSMGSFPDLETAYDAVMSANPSSEDPSQLDYENLDPFISSEGPGGEISRNLSATVTANNEVIKDLIARIEQLEQAAARGQ